MPRISRLLVAAASLLLVAVYFVPLWHIGLKAPQYPEGLGMHIRINAVEGLTEYDLANINNLNHYIGMKPIEPDAIPELKLMPWVLGAIIAGGVLVAALGRRKPLYAWVAGFAALGLAGLLDFWYWMYDYGHHLDVARAIIKIPGMTYQPPLIGSKNLLNFTATSWPAPGGVLAGVSFALAAAAAVLAHRRARAGAPVEVAAPQRSAPPHAAAAQR